MTETTTAARKAQHVAKNQARNAANLKELGSRYDAHAKRAHIITRVHFEKGHRVAVEVTTYRSVSPSRQLRQIKRGWKSSSS